MPKQHILRSQKNSGLGCMQSPNMGTAFWLFHASTALQKTAKSKDTVRKASCPLWGSLNLHTRILTKTIFRCYVTYPPTHLPTQRNMSCVMRSILRWEIPTIMDETRLSARRPTARYVSLHSLTSHRCDCLLPRYCVPRS